MRTCGNRESCRARHGDRRDAASFTGRRICSGAQLALTGARPLVATMARRYRRNLSRTGPGSLASR